jgi:hypothetical protein
MGLSRAVALAAVALCACNCSPSGFSTTLKGEAAVEGNPAGGELKQFPTFVALTNVDLDTTPEFKAQGITRSQVSSLRVQSLKLKILSPSDQDYSFIDSVQFFARSGDREVLVAENVGVAELKLSAPNPELPLDPTGGELRDLLGSPTISLIARGKGRNPPKETRLEATVVVRVDLKVL